MFIQKKKKRGVRGKFLGEKEDSKKHSKKARQS